MTVVPDAPVTPAALSAFLRGVERRGLVLAQLQCGDVAAAERALAAALRAFSSQAAGRPMAGWPMRFWSLLATAPPLRREPMPGTWLPPFTVLGRMQTADRLALLLRIVAGLEEEVASDVQGIAVADYRQSLARACPRDAAGNPDAQAWRVLAEAAQTELRDLTPSQLIRLSQLREASLAGVALQPAIPAEAPPAPRRPTPARVRPERKWHWPSLERRHAGIALGVLALALLLTVLGWWWTHRRPSLPPEPVSQAPAGVLHVTDAAPVLVEELPASDLQEAPAAPAMDPRDQTMLADPDLELARAADFYAWYAAGHPVPADESGAHATAAEQPSAPLETVDDDN
ncbi:hypothetical protein [Xanthomonas vesicatoria]|uniref:Membrane protein n=1 Tax=Xanthomonas vesicatoria TaxID=56460 RepID=A0AAJ0IXX3_9XANT|nr:hypothetical protein [Xanthomonas vesicatoria]APO95372.1 hypothetical protein BI313_12915 [Xanthomonas vesicatoria]KHM92034.1 membrane protein [Xanthomonas vesicatoria]KHM94383.1 membrane protein [Xanthomonas vesicatoria]MCC8620900.1 hypothetical protein [Xanthomonas vesicatoria]MCC8696273.1 hypothetical protein [Xanthomonas vesicatoria]